MKRLKDLTIDERNDVLVPGTILGYEDMANPYQEWTIESILTTRWSIEAVLVSDGETKHLPINTGFQHGWTLVSI